MMLTDDAEVGGWNVGGFKKGVLQVEVRSFPLLPAGGVLQDLGEVPVWEEM